MLLNEYELVQPVGWLLAPVLRLAFRFVSFLTHAVFVLWNLRNKRQVVPQIDPNDEDDRFLLVPAQELAALVREQKPTATHLLEIFIRRAELVNPQLNAVVQRNYEAARKQAHEIDEFVAKLDRESDEFKQASSLRIQSITPLCSFQLAITKPLLGVPISVKDHIGVEGLRVTAGLDVYRDNPPCAKDAVLVQRLKAAEGLMWIETDNTIYGRTCNAYDSRLGVGGSSGGEGALLGAAATVIGIGTDIGGSVRTPAMFNGVFGLKPGPELTCLEGFVPDHFCGYQNQLVGIGPMCRYAKDLLPMFKATNRPPVHSSLRSVQIFADPQHHGRLRLDEPVDVRKLRVFYMEGSQSFTQSPLSPDATTHFQEQLGVSTIRVNLPLAEYGLDMWFAGLLEGGALPLPNFFTGFNPEKALNGLAEIPVFLAGKSTHTLPVITTCAVYDIFAAFTWDPEQRDKIRAILRRQFIDLLGPDGVLIWPSFPRSGYFHNEPLMLFTDVQITALWNALALPVVAVPMGLNASGHPTAVQVVAGPDNERLLCAVAEELERACGGWQQPPGPVLNAAKPQAAAVST
ncbi:Fatty-acid amide hydrolase 2 [Aphelenchoides fujianensis]|nr:Fatty-acid amide hydrolase 2 [Aphelenchoides fujianensis]